MSRTWAWSSSGEPPGGCRTKYAATRFNASSVPTTARAKPDGVCSHLKFLGIAHAHTGTIKRFGLRRRQGGHHLRVGELRGRFELLYQAQHRNNFLGGNGHVEPNMALGIHL